MTTAEYPPAIPSPENNVNEALENDRNLRYQHASEMRSDLQRLKRDTETGRAIAASSGTVGGGNRERVESWATRSGAARRCATAIASIRFLACVCCVCSICVSERRESG